MNTRQYTRCRKLDDEIKRRPMLCGWGGWHEVGRALPRWWRRTKPDHHQWADCGQLDAVPTYATRTHVVRRQRSVAVRRRPAIRTLPRPPPAPQCVPDGWCRSQPVPHDYLIHWQHRLPGGDRCYPLRCQGRGHLLRVVDGVGATGRQQTGDARRRRICTWRTLSDTMEFVENRLYDHSRWWQAGERCELWWVELDVNCSIILV